jgi:protein SCO1/2
VGPDLQGVTRRRDRDWIERYLTAPDRMLAEGDPTAKALYAKYKQVRMPNLGLARSEIAALVEYLDAQGREAAAATVPPSAPRTPAGSSGG